MKEQQNKDTHVLEALCSMCSGEYDLAITQWRRLLSSSTVSDSNPAFPSTHDQEGVEEEPSGRQEDKSRETQDGDHGKQNTGAAETNASNSESRGLEMIKHNLAVCLIYTGRINEARSILEDLVDQDHHSFHALTFNLATIYELCPTVPSGSSIALSAMTTSSTSITSSGSPSQLQPSPSSKTIGVTSSTGISTRDLKLHLAERIADGVRKGSLAMRVGWEGTNADYKL